MGMCWGSLARSRARGRAFAVLVSPGELQPVPQDHAEGWQGADGLHHDLRPRVWH